MKLNLLIALVGLFFVVSCSNNDPLDNCTAGWVLSNEIQDELTALTNAAGAYGQDPSPANCEAYRTAYLAYLDAARDLESCARRAGQLQEFNQAIDEAEEALDDLTC